MTLTHWAGSHVNKVKRVQPLHKAKFKTRAASMQTHSVETKEAHLVTPNGKAC